MAAITSRTVHVGGSYLVGNGHGQVSAIEARQNTRRVPIAEIYNGPAELLDESENVILGGLAAIVTNSENYRPAGATSKYFGTIHIHAGAEGSLASIPAGTVLTLRWMEDQATTRIYLREVDSLTGTGVFTVNGNLLWSTVE